MIPFIGLEFYSNDKFFLRFLHANKSTKLFGGVKSMTADKNEDEIDKTFPIRFGICLGGFQSQGSHTALTICYPEFDNKTR